MTALVLDAAALSALARSRAGSRPGAIHAALRAAVETGRGVVVPAAVLAELYRGGHHDQAIDACLGRLTGIDVADTTRPLARRIGHLLARAGRGSADHVDASVVAVALALGGGVVATGDPDDLEALAAGLPGITVERV
ncbi:MAG: type II toxin-antitoxin system VapC family toxin [Solirubrobacteraceae bacterium]|nr:type II toxin-antitoxin system VapC family toxin [Solirubrobacteraceae bacterium]